MVHLSSIPLPRQRRMPQRNSENNRGKETSKERKLRLIRELKLNTDEIKLQGKINSIEVVFFLDTAARRNYMSKNLTRKLNLNIAKANDECKIELADGSSINTQGTVKCNITLDEFPSYTFKEEFTILKSQLKNILLGAPFLNNQGS